ncbi:MAG: DNA polymerase IV [Acidimicrobiia bacterium]|nr:DNA polymerase IV [Acidimicrobiia bacterium]
MQATILHADLDSFYASVEQRDRPELRGRAMAVGGGVILAASYEARSRGVRTAMPIRAARERCPGLITVDPRMEAYSEASRRVFEIFGDTTPLVEPISIDEAFLDVGGLGRLVGSPELIASRLRERVAVDVGLAISVGVARTKFLAKVASRVCKPDGLLVVEPDGELEFLHPLPVERLWGVGPVTADKLAEKGITTVGEVAASGEGPLVAILGRGSGRHIHALAHNRDPRPVVSGKRRASIGSQRALGRRSRTFPDLEAILLELVDRVSRRLRNGHRVGRTVTLRFRFGDFTRDTRSRTLGEATGSTAAFLDASHGLLVARRDEIARRRLTLLGLTIANLSPADAVQQSLPFDHRSSAELDRALDAVRDRYGSSSIGRATLLGREGGLRVPLLPDPVGRGT